MPFPRLILSFLLLLASIKGEATDWGTLMAEADVIAFVEFKSDRVNGDKMEIITCYKGGLSKGEEVRVWDQWMLYVDYIPLINPKYIVCLNKSESNGEDLYLISTAASVIFGQVACNLVDQKSRYRAFQHPLRDFDKFLKAYADPTLRPKLCKKIFKKLSYFAPHEESATYLMQLYLLGYNQYSDKFESFLHLESSFVHVALLNLMGNIHTYNSRRILSSLMYTGEPWLAGMAIQKLANEPAETVGPLLRDQFKLWSQEDLSIELVDNDNTNGYMYSYGRWEIVWALGKLRYEPSVPVLLDFLNWCDEDEFVEVIDVLKQIGTTAYIPTLNEVLDSENGALLYDVCNVIIRDSIVDCLPSLMNYISTIDRNLHCIESYIVSEELGIGAFGDSATRNFLLADFEKFLNYRDSLDCESSSNWNLEYINSFTKLKEERARSLVYRSFYETCGINEDFGRHPDLFRIKHTLEDSVQVDFLKRLDQSGYPWITLKRCNAFIENTDEVISGKLPKVHYSILVELDQKVNVFDDEVNLAIYATTLEKELGVSADSISFLFNGNVYSEIDFPIYEWCDEWRESANGLFCVHGKYLQACPNRTDVDLFQGMVDYHYMNSPQDEEKMRQVITEMKLKTE